MISMNDKFNNVQLKSYYRNYVFEFDGDIELKEIQSSTLSNSFKNDSKLIKNNIFLPRNAIKLKNIYFKYKKKKEWILNCFQMQIPVGSIYGLLGASGCGKTTLLKLIIGLLKPNSGDLFIFDQECKETKNFLPGSQLGYMPQEISLYKDLSIEEMMIYFGRLYLMSEIDIKKIIYELAVLLKFDTIKKKIDCLSGGEKRRVSLAIAIMHQPKLVILDEPTVGLDPILRKSIWNYLINLVQSTKTTVIITTHYIEEAKNSDLVGMMRKGKLLAEQSPTSLMNNFNLPTLEQVFLRLCKIENSKNKSNLDPIFLHIKQEVDNRSEFILKQQNQTNKNSDFPHSYNSFFNSIKEKNISLSKNCSSFIKQQNLFNNQKLNSFYNLSLNHQFQIIYPRLAWILIVFVLLRKNFIRNMRHPLLIIFQLILPIFQLILFCLAVGGDPFDIAVGVVNDEQPAWLSEKFIQEIDTYYIKKINYTNLYEAKSDVYKGKLWGVVHIQMNFSELFNERFSFNDTLTKSQIETSKIYVYADLSNKFISICLERSLLNSYQKFSKKILNGMGVKPGIVSLPIKHGEPIYGDYIHPTHQGYRDYFASGFMLSISFAMSYGLTCVLLILERLDCMFERHFIAGVRSSQIIFAHAVNRFVFMFVQAILVFIVCVEVFKLPLKGTYSLAISLLALVNLMGLALGLLISSVCKQINTAVVLAISLLAYIFFISGSAWPIQSFPKYLYYFSILHPTTLANISMFNIMKHGWTILNPAVYQGFLMATIWTMIFFVLGIKYFKFS